LFLCSHCYLSFPFLSIRKIWFILADGGPDENPRHYKNIVSYWGLFRSQKLDYLSIRCYAPGQSAYNPCERGMAPLSTRLAGVVLKAFKHGNHLKREGKNVIFC
jgi:hypothetical protein